MVTHRMKSAIAQLVCVTLLAALLGPGPVPSARAEAPPTAPHVPGRNDPEDLRVTDPGTGDRLFLSWAPSDMPDLAGYQISRKVAPAGWVILAQTTGTAYTDMAVSHGGRYWYMVHAYNSTGTLSTGSQAVQEQALDRTPPGPAFDLRANTLPEGRRLQLAWQPGTDGVEAYRIERSRDSGGPYRAVATVPARQTWYRDEGLTDGQTYYYRVIALDAPGNEAVPSGEARGTPADTVAPHAPGELAGEDTRRGRHIRLTWAENKDEDLEGYHVYRSLNRNGPFRRLNDRPVRNARYDDFDPKNPIQNFVYYYYTVTAVDGAGNESPLAAGARREGETGRAEARPSARLFDRILGGVAEATGHDGSLIGIMATDTTPPEWRNAGGAYAPWLLAKSVGWGKLGVNFRLPGDNSGLGRYEIWVAPFGTTNWSMAGSATHSQAEQQPSSSTASPSFPGVGYVESNPAVFKLKAGQRYHVRIRAYDVYDNYAETTDTSTAPATPTMDAAHPPRDLSVATDSVGLTLAWLSPHEDNVVNYKIFRAEQSKPSSWGSTPLATIAGSATSYRDTPPDRYRNYYYRVVPVYLDPATSTQKDGLPSRDVYARVVADPGNLAPHVFFDTETAICGTCHQGHSGQTNRLLRQQTEAQLCFTCHNGLGSRFIVQTDFTYSTGSKHPVDPTQVNGFSCTSCHNPHLNYQNAQTPKLLEPKRQTTVNKGNSVCYQCHGVGSTLIGGDHQTSFEQSGHKASIKDPPSGTEIKCVGCHLPHGTTNARNKRLEGEQVCFECHSFDSNPPYQGGSGTSPPPNVFRLFRSSTAYSRRHDIFPEDQAARGSQITCTNCHNPHRVSQTQPDIQPHSPAPDNAWTGTVSGFCRQCHDNTFPTASDVGIFTSEVRAPTANGEGPRRPNLTNVDTAWNNDTMGGANGDFSKRNLDPAMGWGWSGGTQVYESLECTVCHDPHGGGQEFNLKIEVKSKDGQKVRKGLIYRGGPGNYDFRYFCVTCHQTQDYDGSNGFDMGFDPSQEGGTWPNNNQRSDFGPTITGCISCHYHGSAGKF